MPHKNAVRRREYQREWYAARREKGIAHLGGKCAQCGATDDLEFDHVDPATKVSHRIWSWRWTRIEVELAKCQLLCVACHFTKTVAFISTAGGTNATRKNHHKKGCGCRSCNHIRSAEAGVVIDQRNRSTGEKFGAGELVGVSSTNQATPVRRPKSLDPFSTS